MDGKKCSRVEQADLGRIKQRESRKRKQTFETVIWSNMEFGSPPQLQTKRGAGKRKQMLKSSCSSQLKSNEDGCQRLEESDGTSQTVHSTAVEPTKPGKNVISTKSGKSVEPTKPGNTVEPNKPGKNVEPTKPGKNVEPTKPGNTMEPTKPGNTVETTKPGNSVKPTHGISTTVEPDLSVTVKSEVELNEVSKINQEYEFVECMNIKVEPSEFVERLDPVFVNENPLEHQKVEPLSNISVEMSGSNEIFTFKRVAQTLDPSDLNNETTEKWFRPCKCKQPFNSVTEFTKHACKNVTAKDSVFKCAVCPAISRTAAGLKHHVRKEKHSFPPNSKERYEHMCMYHVKHEDSVENRTISLSLLVEFVENKPRSVANYACLHCASVLPKQCMFKSHLRSEHGCGEGEEVLRCKLCMKCHVDVGILASHLEQIHGEHWCHFVEEDVPYSCVTCEKLFLMSSDESVISLKHINVKKIVGAVTQFKYKITPPVLDYGSKNYACTLSCNPRLYYFSTEHELNIHLKLKHADYVFRTCVCSKICYSMKQYYQHCKNCCKNEELNFENLKFCSEEISKCEKCPLQFENYCSLKIHELVNHDMKTLPSTQLPNGKYACLVCNVEFSNEKLLYAHSALYSFICVKPSTFQSIAKCSILSKTQSSKYNCTICNLGLESKYYVEKHVSNHHYSQLMYCTHCNSNVSNKPNSAITHFKICKRPSLKEDRLFTCPLCGLRFETFQILVTHIVIDMIVLPRKRFQCKKCFNYFFTEYNLCAHVMNGNCQRNLKVL